MRELPEREALESPSARTTETPCAAYAAPSVCIYYTFSYSCAVLPRALSAARSLHRKKSLEFLCTLASKLEVCQSPQGLTKTLPGVPGTSMRDGCASGATLVDVEVHGYAQINSRGFADVLGIFMFQVSASDCLSSSAPICSSGHSEGCLQTGPALCLELPAISPKGDRHRRRAGSTSTPQGQLQGPGPLSPQANLCESKCS